MNYMHNKGVNYKLLLTLCICVAIIKDITIYINIFVPYERINNDL